jgi:putative zinc finger/helix-turn-helix YgiT family protein
MAIPGEGYHCLCGGSISVRKSGHCSYWLEEAKKMSIEHPCLQCGAAMVSSRENYHDKLIGLPYVTLCDIEIARCPNCGEYEVVFPRIQDLYRVLAQTVLTKPSRLTGQEIVFLRKQLDWSATKLAKKMGIAKATLSRWENEKEPIGPLADRLLRLLVAASIGQPSGLLDRLSQISDEPQPFKIWLRYANETWTAETSMVVQPPTVALE